MYLSLESQISQHGKHVVEHETKNDTVLTFSAYFSYAQGSAVSAQSILCE